MKSILFKIFGGLSTKYYFRQIFFAGILATIYFVVASNGINGIRGLNLEQIIFVLICVGLYPYSRFVYESVVNFILGDNVFFLNIFFVMFIKFFTMLMCFALAIFIAPIGMIYLYFYHSKKDSEPATKDTTT